MASTESDNGQLVRVVNLCYELIVFLYLTKDCANPNSMLPKLHRFSTITLIVVQVALKRLTIIPPQLKLSNKHEDGDVGCRTKSDENVLLFAKSIL